MATSLHEKIADFLVACLGKIFVPLADCVKMFRHQHGRYLVCYVLHLAIGGRPNDRCRDYDSRRIQLPQG